MAPFYEALNRISSSDSDDSDDKQVRIAVFGDSFIEADIFTADLREMLQKKEPSPGEWNHCNLQCKSYLHDKYLQRPALQLEAKGYCPNQLWQSPIPDNEGRSKGLHASSCARQWSVPEANEARVRLQIQSVRTTTNISNNSLLSP